MLLMVLVTVLVMLASFEAEKYVEKKSGGSFLVFFPSIGFGVLIPLLNKLYVHNNMILFLLLNPKPSTQVLHRCCKLYEMGESPHRIVVPDGSHPSSCVAEVQQLLPLAILCAVLPPRFIFDVSNTETSGADHLSVFRYGASASTTRHAAHHLADDRSAQ